MSHMQLTPLWRSTSLPIGWRRAETDADAEFACQLVQQNMQPYWARRQMQFSRDMFMEQWAHMDTLIYEPDVTPAGLIAWDIHAPTCRAHLRELHLQSDYRAQGHGRAVMQAWMDECRSVGLLGMCLKVFFDNPAMSLYRHLGFIPAHTDTDVGGLVDMTYSF